MKPSPLEADPKPIWTQPEFTADGSSGISSRTKVKGPSGWLSSLIVFCLTVLLFLPSANNEFVNYDDGAYVIENPIVNEGLSLDGISQAFTRSHSANWHPLTWISHALDVQLYGLDPTGHHITSVLLHALTAVLLLRLLLLLFDERWQALGATLLWALHPLRVESVSWISERKDVLSGMFALLTLIAYVGWVYFPSRARKTWVGVVLALGLMSKSMLVSLPLVMLILDAWPLGRLSRANWVRRLREKTVFFLIAGAATAIAIMTQAKEGAISASDQLGAWTRIENALLSTCIYLKQFFYPGTLTPLYPHIANTSSDPQAALFWPAIGSLLVLSCLAGLALHKRRSMPWIAAGLAWFGVMLLPVIGLLQVGYHAHADRYTYLPSIGLTLIAGALLRLAMRASAKLTLAGMLILLSLASHKTWRQIDVWSNSTSLWEHTLAHDPVNFIAHNNLARALREAGSVKQALKHFRLAQQMDGRDPILLNKIGELQLELGDADAAAKSFAEARTLDPKDWTYALNQAIALESLGSFSEASEALDAVAALGCEDYALALTRGKIAADQGHTAQANALLQEALKLCTRVEEQIITLEQLGAQHMASGNTMAAIQDFEALIALDPGDSFGHYNLGNALEHNGQLAEAKRAFALALSIDPTFGAARGRLDALGAEE